MSLSKETQQKDFHHIIEAINQGMPVVMFDRVANDILCDKVIIDDSLAAFEAVQYLINKGFKKIALISTIDYISVGKLRTEGYLKALRNNNIPIDENLILKVEDMDHCADKIEELMKNNTFDAIFAVNELFAVTSIKLASKLNLKVPEDLSIIGFTDGMISQNTPHQVATTVSQNEIKMGEKAAKMLIDRLENEDEEEEHYKTEVIETNLVERESTT